MSRISQLYDLQQIDSGLDSRVTRMRQIDEQLSDSQELLEARARYKEREKQIEKEQLALRRVSREVDDSSSRLRAQEKRLYDGTIRNPKELGQVSEEVAHLKGRVRELEEQVLERMLAVEEAEAALGASREELDRLEKEQQQFHAGLLEEKDKLLAQAKVLQVKRQRAVGALPWADLQVYERLRRTKGGVAIAGVSEGKCGGCRVLVPANLLRHARAGSDLVNCPTCGRILMPLGDVKYTAFDHDLDNVDR